MHKHYTRYGSAFTIVELLVVIVVIGILAAITIVAYNGISQKAIIASLQSDLTNASTQIKMAQVTDSSGNYPGQNQCPTPSANNICLKSSGGNTFTYTVNNISNPKTFMLDVTNTNGTKYRITNDTTPVAVVGGSVGYAPQGASDYGVASGQWTNSAGLKVTLPSSGTVSTVTAYLKTVMTNVPVGVRIYSDSTGTKGSLLHSSTPRTISNATYSQITFNFSSPMLAAGNYWVEIWSDTFYPQPSSTSIAYDTGGASNSSYWLSDIGVPNYGTSRYSLQLNYL